MKDKNLYVKSYFWIEGGYVWGKGMDNDKYKEFEAEVKALLSSIGFNKWEKFSSHSSIEGFREAESLYCHPQDLVGYVIKDKIKEIEKVLKEGKTFTYNYVTTYEETYNYTEEELKQELDNKRTELEQTILESFKTKRRNLYKSSRPLWDIRTGIKFFRDELSLKNIERNFILTLFDYLVKEGKVIEGSNYKIGKIYRSVTKKDILKTNV